MGVLDYFGLGSTASNKTVQRGVANAGKGGLIPGMIQGYYENQADDAKKNTLQDAKRQLEDLKRQQREQRMADLDRAMTYFDPIDDYRRDFAKTNAGYTGTPGYAPPRRMMSPTAQPPIPPMKDFFGGGGR